MSELLTYDQALERITPLVEKLNQQISEELLRSASDDGLHEQELRLIEMINEIRSAYEKSAKPYIDQLVLIRSLRQPAPIFIAIQEYERAVAIEAAERMQG